MLLSPTAAWPARDAVRPRLVTLFWFVISALLAVSCTPEGAPDDENAAPRVTRETSPPTDSTPELDGVRLEVGDDFQQRVDAEPPGTRFVIAAGLHRLQQVTPRNGDQFVGESGAIMSGARVLTTFAQEDGRWFAADQTQEAEPQGEVEPGRERDAYPHDVFLDGERLQHVASVDEVGPGRWFFDYEADRIYLGDDPSGRLVETSVAPWAFAGPDVSDVTIENLTVQQYASPAQNGAIHGDGAWRWTVRHVEASFNHGGGIRVGPGWEVTNCRVAYNGQIGISGNGENDADAPIRVADCEIAHNKQLGYDWGWEGGATKFARTAGMVFENNWVHNNIGPGPWFDIDNEDAVIRSNLVEDNSQVGIFYEISFAAEIYWNEVRNNGAQAPGDLGAGVFVSNSSDVRVFENLVYGNKHEILALQADRGGSELGRYDVRGLQVHDNDVTVQVGLPGLRVTSGEDEYYWERGVEFEGNTYRLDSPQGEAFYWGEVLDAEGWQAVGNDRSGRFLDLSQEGALPDGAVPFVREEYGPR